MLSVPCFLALNASASPICLSQRLHTRRQLMVMLTKTSGYASLFLDAPDAQLTPHHLAPNATFKLHLINQVDERVFTKGVCMALGFMCVCV